MLDFGVKPWEMNRFRPSELDHLERFLADEKAKTDDATRRAGDKK
jgi:hypothetical protein